MYTSKCTVYKMWEEPLETFYKLALFDSLSYEYIYVAFNKTVL